MNKEKSQKRRLYKQNARKVVKHHYFVLMMLCLVAIYFGAEYRYVTSQTNDTYNVLTGRNIDGTALSAWFWSFHSLQTWFTHIMFRTQAKELQTTRLIKNQVNIIHTKRRLSSPFFISCRPCIMVIWIA